MAHVLIEKASVKTLWTCLGNFLPWNIRNRLKLLLVLQVRTMFIVLLIVASMMSPQEIFMATASKTHQDSDYLKFVTDATELPLEQYYDYIVVGGGAAGCPLAATLSEKYSVLLLERGGTPHENPEVLHQDKLFNVLLQTNDKDSPAQKFISEDGVSNVRARVLGGGTVINGGFYSRGNAEFYKGSGIEWDMDRVSESYQWVEERIVYEPHIENWEWEKSVKEGLLEAGANTPYHGYNLDHAEGTKISGSIFDRDGTRHPAMELLSSGNRDNLKVAVHATVEKVVFSSSDSSPAGLHATGVIYKDSTGVSHRAILKDSNGEVILSAGALGSTQLLLLSGVGPEQYLSSLNISTVKHNPYVGKYLSDPPRNNINIIPPFPVGPNGLSVVAITPDYYIEAISSTYGFESPINPLFFPYPSPPLNISVLSIFEKLANATSVGSLHLMSPTDVEVSPQVRFNYFSSPEDLARCVRGMRNIKQVMNSNAMEKYKFQGNNGGKSFQFVGGSWSEHASLEAMCRDTVTTIWHYHGGCVVGKVVDQDLKVIGVNALRVVDGSTFTMSPGTNPQATLMMFGRYVGLKIKEERSLMERHENMMRSEL